MKKPCPVCSQIHKKPPRYCSNMEKFYGYYDLDGQLKLSKRGKEMYEKENPKK